MPKDTSKQPADDGDQQPRRRSNRSSTREQTLLEKEAKKAEEARALVNLPPGQKYFYITPEGVPIVGPETIQPGHDGTAEIPLAEASPQGQMEPGSTPQQWVDVKRKKSISKSLNGQRKPFVQSHVKKGETTRGALSPVPATTVQPAAWLPTQIMASSSGRPGDGQPSYAAAVSSGPKRVRSNLSAAADEPGTTGSSDDVPPVKKPRVPTVTARRRTELSEAAESWSREELSARKTSAKTRLGNTKPIASYTADRLGQHTHDTVQPSQPSPSAPTRAEPAALSPNVTTSPKGGATPGESIQRLEALKAKCKATLLATSVSAAGSHPQGDASEDQSAATTTGTPTKLSSRTLTPSPQLLHENETIVPFSNGWEGYDSKEDRNRWASGVRVSSQSSPT